MHACRAIFGNLAEKAANMSGSPIAFVLAALMIIVWGITGPIFDYSEVWQLVINTTTTIITFLLVFLIQNSQNREMCAVQLKLDELIRAIEGAHNIVLSVEKLTEQEIHTLHEQYAKLSEDARRHLKAGQGDQDVPEIVLKDTVS